MLSLHNPKYAELERLGKSTRWCAQYITLPALTSQHLQAENKTTIELFWNQRPVYDSVKDCTTSLIEAPTSFGKSVLAVALHQAWGGRTIVACHNLTLAKQFASEFARFAPECTVTFYCNSKHDSTGDVVITTHTTLRQKYNVFQCDNLIIDEADLFLTDKSVKAIIALKAQRKHGMTGTIKTVYDTCNDIQGGVLSAFWGKYIKGEEDKTKVPDITVYYRKYKKEYTTPQGYSIRANNWIEYRKVLNADMDRKSSQLKYIQETSNGVEPCLVLFDTVADVYAFYRAMIKRNMRVYMQTGEMPKKERDAQLSEFKKNGGYLIAQTKTADRGFSHTPLVKCYILYPLRAENTLVQIIGRLKRFFEGKKASLYLWSDSTLGFQFREQKKIINLTMKEC